MTRNDFLKNRPFEPDDEVLELLKQWSSPVFEETAELTDKTNAFGLKRPAHTARAGLISVDDEHVAPLTAEDIEQIRQAAFDEGMQQGKEEGFAQGYAEGREQGYQDGQQQGIAEGKKQGLEQGEQLIQQQLAHLNEVLDKLQAPLNQVDQQVEQALLELALAMAQAVVAVELKTNPTVVLESLRQCLELLPMQSKDIQIQLPPADHALVLQHYGDEEIAKRGWQLQMEPALESGDIRISTGHSLIHRTLKQRVQQSLEQFLQTTS